MVAIGVAIVSGVVLRTTLQSLRREELNAVSVELYGWLESVQRRAMSVDPTLRSQNPDAYTCRVSFSRGTLEPGSVLATTPRFCAPGSPSQGENAVFLLPNTNTENKFVVQTFQGTAVTFSPRGTVSFDDGPDNPTIGPLTVEITLEGSSVSRCVQVEQVLGFLAIGAMNNQTPSDALDCPSSSFDGAF